MPREIDTENLKAMQAAILEPRWLVEISAPINLRLCSRGSVTLGDYTYRETQMRPSFDLEKCLIHIGEDSLRRRFTKREDRTDTTITIGSMFGSATRPTWWWEGFLIRHSSGTKGIRIEGNIYELGRKVGVLCNATWARHLVPEGAKVITRSGITILTNGIS